MMKIKLRNITKIFFVVTLILMIGLLILNYNIGVLLLFVTGIFSSLAAWMLWELIHNRVLHMLYGIIPTALFLIVLGFLMVCVILVQSNSGILLFLIIPITVLFNFFIYFFLEDLHWN